MQINIIDTTSPEFNRGSFCYSPYLCYIGLKKQGYEVSLTEAFKPEDLDSLGSADIYLISLWSYPQIENAIMLAQTIPFMTGNNNVYFIGYRPLIEYLGLRYIFPHFLDIDPAQDPIFLQNAMEGYPANYKKFNRLLLSDCDMHLKSLEADALVHPLFTTYGCPNRCTFCPSTINCNYKRVILPLDRVFAMLDECISQNIHYIHFTDEDFFYDINRAYHILHHLRKKEMHMIALGSATSVYRFITKHGTEIIVDSGLEVIEIGFESASAKLSTNMGAGKSLSNCEKLAQMQSELPFTIFWLVMTFFPGETISSLNETGRFMKTYGLSQNDVVGRLRTNGTEGGLGQFFQPYHGTPIFNRLEKEGLFLTTRPIRLIPSYIPNSFLDSRIQKILTENYEKVIPWLELYNIQFPLENIKKNCSIKEYIPLESPMYEKIQTAIAFAILARMEVIQ